MRSECGTEHGALFIFLRAAYFRVLAVYGLYGVSCRKHLARNGLALLEAGSRYFLGGTGRTTKPSVTEAGVAAEIRTQHTPSVNPHCYL
jgi:hypothetical protein